MICQIKRYKGETEVDLNVTALTDYLERFCFSSCFLSNSITLAQECQDHKMQTKMTSEARFRVLRDIEDSPLYLQMKCLT